MGKGIRNLQPHVVSLRQAGVNDCVLVFWDVKEPCPVHKGGGKPERDMLTED